LAGAVALLVLLVSAPAPAHAGYYEPEDDSQDSYFVDTGQQSMDAYIESGDGGDEYYASEAYYGDVEELEKVWIIHERGDDEPDEEPMPWVPTWAPPSEPTFVDLPVDSAFENPSYADGGNAIPVDDVVVAAVREVDMCKTSMKTNSTDLSMFRMAEVGPHLTSLALAGKIGFPSPGQRFLVRYADGGSEVVEVASWSPPSGFAVAIPVSNTLVEGSSDRGCPA
jgi:hypothetical protein